jgi:HK97 family phage major capsid protein
VATSTSGSYIDMLRNRSVVLRLGAQHLPGQRDALAIPRQAGAASVTWLPTEGSTIIESQQTIQQIAVTPKNVGAYTEISRQLLLQSNPSAEQLVVADLAAISALAMDDAGLNGDGSGGKPTGIRSTLASEASPEPRLPFALAMRLAFHAREAPRLLWRDTSRQLV